MAWIKIRNDIEDDPAVISISAKTNLETDHVVGKLRRLWAWADEQTYDGNAAGVTAAWVDAKVGLTGFAAAMMEVGWLQLTNQGIAIPNFDRHNGQTAKDRILTAKRVAKSKAKSNGTGNGQVTAQVTVSPLTREEKIREEKIEDKDSNQCDVPRLSPSDIDAIYAAYPRHVGKGPAYQAIRKALVRLLARKDLGVDAGSWLLERVQAFAHSPAGQAGTYTPHPTTWFNGDRFDDDPAEWQKEKISANGHANSKPAVRRNPFTQEVIT